MENKDDKKKAKTATVYRKKSNMTGSPDEAPLRGKRPKPASGLRVGKSRMAKIEKKMPKARKWYTNKKKEEDD